jgi:hypothetical protein
MKDIQGSQLDPGQRVQVDSQSLRSTHRQRRQETDRRHTRPALESPGLRLL